MSGYWLVRTTASRDQESSDAYGKLWSEIAERYNARVIAGRGAHETREGENWARNLIIEFPSYQDALDCYDDPDYTEATKVALKAFERELVIMEGT